MRQSALVTAAIALLIPALGHGGERSIVARALDQPPEHEFYLPKGLSEISGLTSASLQSVYAHNDEFGIVYEINILTGKAMKAFALGKPTIKADFEDIAAHAGNVYLLASDGRIFEARAGEHRKRVLYNVYDTGVGRRCETEGLTNGPTGDSFLVLCKVMHDPTLKERLVIFAWNLRDRAPTETPWLSVPLDGLIDELDQANFHPSALAWRHDTRTLTVVSSKDRIAIEVDARGRLVSRFKLDKKHHRQPEALAIMPDGRIAIGDEGERGRGKIAVYSGWP